MDIFYPKRGPQEAFFDHLSTSILILSTYFLNDPSSGIELLNNKDSDILQLKLYHIQEAWHSFIDAKCRWHSNQLDGTASDKEPLGQRKGMKIHQGTTLQG